ncbi:MAG: ABC transporter ATP-binding protein [Candidatus Bipolaricaulota bacterium]|nr:ABC transporter ATP-binding protein [Candidatus Bipolaricaulota bacterium]
MLELAGLWKRFGDVTAVADFSLAVGRGELLALLGPSGCGKTTVLRIVAGLESPDAGRVLLEGQDVTAWPPEKRGIGLVFQNYALFPHLSVAGNVAYGLRTGGDRRGRVRELLELVGLSGYERRRPHQLSAGQQQRVALARALAREPRVLLLDEPLSALDAALRKELRGELRRLLKKLGMTAIYVTHDQEEALALADRVGVMREGRLEGVDTPEGLYRRPRTPFVASFLGRANLWPGWVVGVDGDRALVEVAGVRIPAERGEAEAGDEVLLFFRPEWVEVGEGPLAAEVEGAEYLGDRWELRARCSGLPLVLVTPKRPDGSRVSFALATARAVRPGDPASSPRSR